MYDYPSNSRKLKAENKEQPAEKKVNKVVTGKVVTKQNNARKLSSIFIADDVNNVKSHIFMEVLVPALKKAVSDMVRDGIDMLLYGEAGNKKRSSNTAYVSYDKRYNGESNRRTSTVRAGYHFDDIGIESRVEAEEVLDCMNDAIDRYGVVSVADLYDLCGLNHSFTDNKYGWTSLRNAAIVRDRDGYTLKLPRAVPID